ncbi:I8L [African swine fever virus]|uniref:I8L n=4 Tax=African swine fever virus TaxID=10497 RepID=A0A0A1E105_ASF|nr:pI8L [African swine fever virus]YP_009702555.1 pBA71-M103L [African swine fever virus]YP_009702716.1 pI8L [African swine fever virus]YP_009703206.1 I8L [African swine fever virus]YP_009703438.1 pI8L [African swine fever virus]YP_009703601.1 pI8L [African swine fever virus Benin 97/1]YP_009703757.1 pI8L [African swine fever virus OURT 88/3]YP_009703919.1 hypothetical protein F8224_gp161 [African swine fever virus E75]YP_009927275.1 hypothetical protein IM014_gp186 [African swine fever vir
MGNRLIKKDLKKCEYYYGEQQNLKQIWRLLFNEPLGTYVVSSFLKKNYVVISFSCPTNTRIMHLRINICYDLYCINGEYYEKIDDFIRLYPHIFYRPLYRYKS